MFGQPPSGLGHDPMFAQGVGALIVLVIVLFVVFLLLREVNCWYWKINKRIDLLEEQNRLLQRLVAQDERNDTAVSAEEA